MQTVKEFMTLLPDGSRLYKKSAEYQYTHVVAGKDGATWLPIKWARTYMGAIRLYGKIAGEIEAGKSGYVAALVLPVFDFRETAWDYCPNCHLPIQGVCYRCENLSPAFSLDMDYQHGLIQAEKNYQGRRQLEAYFLTYAHENLARPDSQAFLFLVGAAWRERSLYALPFFQPDFFHHAVGLKQTIYDYSNTLSHAVAYYEAKFAYSDKVRHLERKHAAAVNRLERDLYLGTDRVTLQETATAYGDMLKWLEANQVAGKAPLEWNSQTLKGDELYGLKNWAVAIATYRQHVKRIERVFRLYGI